MEERSPAGKSGSQSDTFKRECRTLRVKMVLLGGSGVGKSSLALRFSKGIFRNISPTIGCAYLTQSVYLRDVTLRFEIWDTAGQEKYHSVTPLYYRGAHAALIVYDVSKRDSFIRAQMWLKELQAYYIPGTMVIGLVGNKEDLSHIRQVSTEEGHRLAVEKDLFFLETSALSGHQVNELLLAIANRIKETMDSQQGGLTEWRETPLLDLNQSTSFRSFPSCCPRVGP